MKHDKSIIHPKDVNEEKKQEKCKSLYKGKSEREGPFICISKQGPIRLMTDNVLMKDENDTGNAFDKLFSQYQILFFIVKN